MAIPNGHLEWFYYLVKIAIYGTMHHVRCLATWPRNARHAHYIWSFPPIYSLFIYGTWQKSVLELVSESMIFLTRGDRIFIMELARGSFQDENSVPSCKKYHFLAHVSKNLYFSNTSKSADGSPISKIVSLEFTANIPLKLILQYKCYSNGRYAVCPPDISLQSICSQVLHKMKLVDDPKCFTVEVKNLLSMPFQNAKM